MDLKYHLESFGIHQFDDRTYWEWRDRVLGEARTKELDGLRKPLQQACATPPQLARYWDFVARSDVASAVFSGRACTIRVAGEFVSAHLPATGRILDVGCSTGHLTTYYALVSPGTQVTGCDLSNESINRATEEAARRLLGNVRFRQADWVSDIAGEQFDCVVATHALAFTFEDGAALAQLASLLPNAGRLICVDSFDRAEAEAFVSGCAAHGLALRSFEMLFSSDAGVHDVCPGFVFEKGGTATPVDLDSQYTMARAVLEAGGEAGRSEQPE